jgi:phage gp36-like protein
MAYSLLADIKKLIPEETLIQLTDDEGAGIVNQVRLDEAIAHADEEINSYLGLRYNIPFASPIPGIVKKMSVDITIYNLYSRKLETIPSTRGDRYKNAIRMLEGISKGTVSIGESTEPAGETDQVKADRTAEDRIFTGGKKSDGSGGTLDNY